MKHALRVILLSGAATLLLHADAGGPNPGLAGVPGEAGTCANCHGGNSGVNTKGGSVSIAFPKGNTYVPGEVHHWIVTITDSSARRWGYQAAARKTGSTGTLAPTSLDGVRHPPRSGWLDELGRLKGGRPRV